MSTTAPITFHLHLPHIDGETVTFRWDASAPIRFQKATSFWFRYEGIDLAWFAPELLLEIFLALELKVLGALDRPVHLVLPQAIPAPVADFWRGWNDAWNVEITPLSSAPAYDPWRISPHPRPRQHRRAVFFGGGKDSTLVSQFWREADGADDVLLVRGIYFATPGAERLDVLRTDAERRLLQPNRDAFGLASACYWTNYPTTIHPNAAAARPHLELHTAGALPILLAHGVTTAAFCIEYFNYVARRLPDAPMPAAPKPRSAPEFLASQSAHYHDVLGARLTITNPLWPMSISGIFKTLVERYPAAAGTFVSCSRWSHRRWCMSCSKCLRSGTYLLAAGWLDPDYDFSIPFTSWRGNLDMLTAATRDLPPGAIAPWSPDLPELASHFEERCDTIARIDLATVGPALGPAAYDTLARLLAAYGNVRAPRYLQVPRTALARLPHDVAALLESSVAPHLDIVDDLPDYLDPTGATHVLPWHLFTPLPRGMAAPDHSALASAH